MSIGTSSLFKEVLTTYEPDSTKCDAIINSIKKYEHDIMQKIPLEKIKVNDYNQYLNLSLDYIEKANSILSWTSQIRLKILRVKNNVSKRLELKIKSETRRIEDLDFIIGITSKTEKDKQKKFFLEESVLEMQYELENVKVDLEYISTFIKDAENLRDLVYSYYQAIKTMQIQM